MEERTLTIKYQVCHFKELGTEDRELVLLARKATYTSYAPYSHFYVGAALRMSGGATVSGSNQENAAFGAGTCAERCALFHAQAAFPEETVVAIAIAARGASGMFTQEPVSPCGICRQALMEAQIHAKNAQIRVLLCGERDIIVVNGIKDLLPFAFDTIL